MGKRMEEQVTPVPVVVLAGFLGSGKTSLLTRLLDGCREAGIKPAVVLNELGDLHLEGARFDSGVPLKEMLNGCICCTMKGDLAGELVLLARKERPDIILIEATGAANPLELVEGVMDAALHEALYLSAVVTVVDGPGMLRLKGSRRTMKLMEDGIRCATKLVLNKADLLHPEELVEVQQRIGELNFHATLVTVRHGGADAEWIESVLSADPGAALKPEEVATRAHGGTGDASDARKEHGREHAHEHLMAVTYYPQRPYDSMDFESMLLSLPDNVYRAKGIVTFADTASRYHFQFAYRETDFMPLSPAESARDAIVFIGEHFSRAEVLERLAALEAGHTGKAE